MKKIYSNAYFEGYVRKLDSFNERSTCPVCHGNSGVFDSEKQAAEFHYICEDCWNKIKAFAMKSCDADLDIKNRNNARLDFLDRCVAYSLYENPATGIEWTQLDQEIEDIQNRVDDDIADEIDTVVEHINQLMRRDVTIFAVAAGYIPDWEEIKYLRGGSPK